MKRYRDITVFCASSPRAPQRYTDAAYELGVQLAKAGVCCVCGAGISGLMAALTDGALSVGGKVLGVIPQFMVDNNWMHPELTDVVVTEDMHTRKEYMNGNSDATIALPGGIGTMEELMEVICWKQLGLYDKPIVILNINGFYDSFVQMLRRGVEESLMRESDMELFMVANTVDEAIRKLESVSETKYKCNSDKYN